MDFYTLNLLLEAETIGIGLCFPYAIKLATSMLADGVFKDIRVVHGTVFPEWHHRRYWHAWVEADNRAYDWQMKTNRKGSMTIDDFYKEYKPENVKKYTPAKAVGMAIKTGKGGPWHENVL